MPSKHSGSFCLEIGSTAVFSLCCQQHVCFVLISEFGVPRDLKIILGVLLWKKIWEIMHWTMEKLT